MPSRQFQHQVPQIWAIQSITCHERLQNLNGGEHLLPNKNRLVNNKMNININPKKYETEKMRQFWHPTSLLNQFWHPTSLLNQFWHPTSLLKQFWHPTSLLNQFWHPTSLLKQFWHLKRPSQSVLTSNVLAQAVLTSNVLAQSVLTSNVLALSVLTSSLLAHEAGVLCGLLSKTTVFETCNCFWRNCCKCSEKNGANLPPHPDMPAECACSQPLH